MKILPYIHLLFVILPCCLLGQTADPVLFTVNGNPIHLSEFEYIYNKNNGKDADYSTKSLQEYLNLYIKFKLKVQAARDMKVDTIPALIKELEGYRQQLTSNYLNDKEVTDRLAREVYDRQKKDLHVSHILYSLSPNALPEDTLKIYTKAIQTINSLQQGSNWDQLAKSSNDLNSAQNGGKLGWLTAMLPDGFYSFENAIYSLKVGEYTRAPVRTRLGYHIIKLDAERPAYRRMEAAQILIKKSIKNEPDWAAKAKADSLYKLIKSGASFEELARIHSDDKNTNMHGGNIGFFGINQFESQFEEAAFSLSKDGDISMPVESSIGYHIIKRLRKEEELPYERAKRKIQLEIAKDERFALAQNSLIEKIKAEARYTENPGALQRMATKMDTNFFTYKWKVPDDLPEEKLFSLGGEGFTTLQFAEFLKFNTRQRIQGSDQKDILSALNKLLKEFVSQKCLIYEESRLEEKYPDFKALMREYREGILLFEATKNLVWDRASEDTAGLKLFYEKNKGKYKWEERAVIYSVTIDTTDKKLVDAIHKFVKKKSVDAAIKKFDPSKSYISYQRNTVEKRSKDQLEGLAFQKGSITLPVLDKELTSYIFKKVENILPSSVKTLEEARGFIIAEYQDHLEALWVDELRAKYPVVVNDQLFNSLIKK